jgi:chorismate synthase
MDDVPRPSHADYTYQVKYGVRASSGGGRSSARETIGRVAAGAVAEKWLRERYNESDHSITREVVDKSIIRCPDDSVQDKMIKEVESASAEKDSIGGVVTVVCRNVPVGLGEPCFDKLEALLGHAMLSIPATKGFEVGSGFSGTRMRGSKHNDPYVRKTVNGAVVLGTATNNSGGIQGGISNGEDIVMRIAFKPPATIGQEQHTASFTGQDSELKAKGRHDPCVVPRAVPIVEAMAALVLADAALQQEARIASSNIYAELGKIKKYE